MAANSSNTETPILPSTIDDIPSLGTRCHPLSSQQLHDIRSLIGAAKSSVGDGAVGNKKVAADAPLQPLAGRRVMVPMTSKAFFEGTLQPLTKVSESASPANAVMGEQIIVNDGGKLVEMTRAEASDLFDKQHELASAKTRAASASKSAPKKSALKPGKSSSGKANTTSKNAIAPKKKAMPEMTSDSDPTLPYMEIREECDVGGNIINSEIVNMSSTMERLGDGLKNVTEGGDSEEEGKHLGELLAQTLKEGEMDIAKDVHAEYSESVDEGEKEERAEDKPKPISDSEYELLCSRLEELERLEEENEKSKKANAKSSKRLQSNGWSKGFLNNTKKKSAPRKKVSLTSTTKKEANTSASESKQSTSKPNAPPEKGSRVSFSGDNKIKEIPRIGMSKVPPRPASGRPVSFKSREMEVPEVDPYSRVQTVPFEDNVFRGVVKERNDAPMSGNVRESKELKESSAAGGEKRLSRFAQRRLERE